MNGDPTKKLPEGLTPEAQIQRARFEATYRELLTAARQVSLSVLVWGQNPRRRSRVARKRREIYEALMRLGHAPIFPEELHDADESASQKAKELAQAKAADVIIALIEASPGALAEVHDFFDHPEIASKLFVLVPVEYEGGYSAVGALKDHSDAWGGVFWYQAEDLDACRVASAAIRRVEARRHIRYRHGK